MKVITRMPNTYKSHCDGCPYDEARHLSTEDKATRSTPLSMENNCASILLVFQAPGENEWEEGRPICSEAPGSAGTRLKDAFRKLGKTREDFNITNCVQCFPGKRSINPEKPLTNPDAKPRDKAPSAEARAHCSRWLREDIEAANYKRIVVFGKVAAKMMRPYDDGKRCIEFLKHPAGGLSNSELQLALELSTR